MSLVNVLPDEILMHVASYLSATDLRTCHSVCDRLHTISREYCLWSKFFVDINTGTPAEGRLCHTSIMHDNKMYVFGGHITQPSSEYFHSVKKDTIVYDFESKKWLSLSEEGCPQRTEHSAVTYKDSMYIYGGYSGAGYENGVMEFNLKDHTWKTLETSGDIPSARSAHTAVIVENKMYIFGGWNGIHCMNDLYELDVLTGVWKLISANTSHVISPGQQVSAQPAGQNGPQAQNTDNAGNVNMDDINKSKGVLPVARCSHGATVVQKINQDGSVSPCMYVFGGYAIEGAAENSNRGYLNDLFEYDFNTNTWTQTKARGEAPTPRSRFKMISYGQNVFLFAGWNSLKHFSSLHKYDLTENKWTEQPTNFDTNGLGQFSMVEHNGVAYIFSGYTPNSGTRTNLYAYLLAQQPSTRYSMDMMDVDSC
eukprot:TRINITY_DN678_c0_g1_i1.p1 TRINITY_DN678_c0_g1~~TRINITY_DN678_c0_g1_i1.p1  ORF type:complete len:424 (-),score=55.85 TRINITY_DN678_c0_g1_i1:213-1484(-)